MKKKTLIIFTVILGLFVSVSFAFAGGRADKDAGLSGSVKIAGSSTVYPVSVAVAEEFNRFIPGWKYQFSPQVQAAVSKTSSSRVKRISMMPVVRSKTVR